MIVATLLSAYIISPAICRISEEHPSYSLLRSISNWSVVVSKFLPFGSNSVKLSQDENSNAVIASKLYIVFFIVILLFMLYDSKD